MVDKYKGVIEFDVVGQKRGFKFGVRSMSLFCNSLGIPFRDGAEALQKAEFDSDMDTVIKFYLAGAIAYARLNKLPDPTIDEVYAIIEEVGTNEMARKLKEVHDIPNVQAPETGQP